MPSSNVITVLEVGTGRTVALVGRAREGGGPPEVLGYGEASTAGVRKGRVLTPEYVRTAVEKAVGDAGRQARTDVRDVALVCSCGDVSFETGAGEAEVADPEAVSPQDLAAARRAFEAAVAPPEGRLPFEAVRLYCTIDDDPAEIADPVGMPGSRLRVHGILPHVAARHANLLADAVSSTERDVNYLVFSGLAAARVALSPQQREDGALCIDIGRGTTSWCAYRRRHPVALGALPVGGSNVTDDLLAAFNPGSKAAAERFKVESGRAWLRGIAADERVPLHPDLGDPNRTVSRRAAAEVVHARMDETFRLVLEDLRRRGALHGLGAGVVLTGGGAYLQGAAELASSIFHAPCTLASFSSGCREIDADPVRNAVIWGGLVQAVLKDRAEQEAAARRGGPLARLGRRIFGNGKEAL